MIGYGTVLEGQAWRSRPKLIPVLSPQVLSVINPTEGCHYLLPGPGLPSRSYGITHWWQRHRHEYYPRLLTITHDKCILNHP